MMELMEEKYLLYKNCICGREEGRGREGGREGEGGEGAREREEKKLWNVI